MSQLSVTSIQSLTASTPPLIKDSAGVEVGTFCRAWVNFNGTGTVAIRADFNVSSITDNGTGDYTVNFSAAMVDANYAAVCGGLLARSCFTGSIGAGWLHSTTQVKVGCYDIGVGNNDAYDMQIAIFR